MCKAVDHLHVPVYFPSFSASYRDKEYVSSGRSHPTRLIQYAHTADLAFETHAYTDVERPPQIIETHASDSAFEIFISYRQSVFLF